METILLCGEGPTDYGKKDYFSGIWIDGPVQNLIRRSITVEVDIKCIEKQEIKNVRLRRTKLHGHAVKAYKLALLANDCGIKYAICYVDADKRKFGEVYSEINDGFDAYGNNRVKGIPMVPLKMIECWLLSDENAYKIVFGSIPKDPGLPSKPEQIWGDDNDPDSNYPKCLFNRVAGQYSKTFNDLHNFIAGKTDIKTLRGKIK